MEDEIYFYIIMEYIEGGELFTKLKSMENQVFNEQQVALYIS